MAANVKASGKYDYKVIEANEKVCSIDFYQGKEKLGNSKFTIEDAKKAGTKNIDKYPKNMLFARAISNGVKFFTPDIFSGPVYTPEEMATVTEDVQAEVTTGADPVKVVIHDIIWQPTAAEMQELSELVDNSTLEDKRKEAARIAITECKTQKDVDKIKAALLKAQPNG